MQFQADVLQLPVERPDMVETTALGAAGLAGVASGIWKEPDDFLAGRRFSRFLPQAARTEADGWYRGWTRAVNAALSWARADR
jgi:glycerol kinase